MKCPYCGRQTRDTLNHLVKYQKCWEKHKDRLMLQILEIKRRTEDEKRNI
jgi:4-hydroxy-3-methylbut-2-en-1-yl diphosphate synthase IspG/GcpE